MWPSLGALKVKCYENIQLWQSTQWWQKIKVIKPWKWLFSAKKSEAKSEQRACNECYFKGCSAKGHKRRTLHYTHLTERCDPEGEVRSPPEWRRDDALLLPHLQSAVDIKNNQHWNIAINAGIMQISSNTAYVSQNNTAPCWSSVFSIAYYSHWWHHLLTVTLLRWIKNPFNDEFGKVWVCTLDVSLLNTVYTVYLT